MEKNIYLIISIFIVGLTLLNTTNATDYNPEVFENVKFDGKDMDVGVTRMRDYNRGETLTLTFDIISEKVTNTSLKDVRVEAFIEGDAHGDDIDDISNRFEVHSDRVYGKILYLTIPDRMDRDVYTLRILLTSKEGVIAEASYDVSIASGDEEHNIIIDNVIFSPEGTVEAGHAFLATVKVKNLGTWDENNVKVRVAVPDLGISASAFLDEIEIQNEKDNVITSEELYLRVPKDALTGDYVVVVTAQYNDYDKTLTEEYIIHIQGKETEEETPTEKITKPILICKHKEKTMCINSSIIIFQNITYIFDRGYKIELNEAYNATIENCSLYNVYYGGENCRDIIKTIPLNEHYSQIIGLKDNIIKNIDCGRCPDVCEREPPLGKDCGACICQNNRGFCDDIGLRNTINETKVYCFNELWILQKQDEEYCNNNFECLSNFCSKNGCYDIEKDVEKNKDLLTKIYDWIKNIFRT